MNPSFPIKLLLAALILLISIGFSVGIGSVAIASDDIFQILLYHLTGWQWGSWLEIQERILWLIRLPRTLLAVLVGSGLTVAGVVMQALVRNPLASPYLLGVSSGASFGAALVMLSGFLANIGRYSVSLGAFLGALLAFSMVFLLARGKQALSSERLILSGVAVAALFGAFTSFVVYLAPNKGVKEVMFWMLGSLSGTSWNDLWLPAIILILVCSYLLLQARTLNVMLMGEETAITLGVNPSRLRIQLFVLVSLLGGVLVAVSGVIGFVGLMMPHIVRLLVRSDHRRVLPMSLLCGSTFLVLADLLARTLLSPIELPIGILTALAGAPFFLWLMRR